DQTGRGVPLVELRTIHHLRFVSDSAGFVAVRDSDLLGQSVFFHVSSHGYEFPKDGFGYRGKALKVEPGGDATLKIKRLNVAERPGDGPTWIGGLVVLPDAEGRERLFCGYAKVRGLLEIYERGIAQFDDERREFIHVQRFDKDVPLFPNGHPFLHTVNGVEYV